MEVGGLGGGVGWMHGGNASPLLGEDIYNQRNAFEDVPN